MTPLPDANDAPDSLLSPTTSEHPLSASKRAGNVQGPPHLTAENVVSASTSVGSSSRSPSYHSQTDHKRQSRESGRSPSPFPAINNTDDVREAILASFAPRVVVLASEDTDDIAKEKGFAGGFYSLLRPFGEDVPGKVVVRDSVGASKGWDNFSIRLIQYIESLDTVAPSVDQLRLRQLDGDRPAPDQSLRSSEASTIYERREAIDALLEKVVPLTKSRLPIPIPSGGNDSDLMEEQSLGKPSSSYILYLRKLLSETHHVPYETFTHPVACIIAVSSRSQNPLEKIRQLYSASGRANYRIPPWVGVDYLRYYVLVHDEDRDEIAKSTALFDLMKRHFGLHCFLLRLRSTRCAETDDDSVRMPRCEWMSADEELAGTRESDLDDDLAAQDSIFESDAAAMKSFIRELVTQSIVPFMESRIVTWNDQIASKRRGIGGRFMSLSKKWTGFGSSRGSNSTTAAGPSSSNSNFDPAKGFYPPESPEAIMRQLADYSFMLGDFKLAFSTYDTLRTDFSNDKAWLYHASACEFACVSYLLIPQTLSNRSRAEMVDQKLDAALFSYLTRSSVAMGAVRSILLTVELSGGKGPAAAADAAKWATRLLDLGILTPLPQALLTERIADIYRSQGGSGSLRLGSRRRHAILWNTLASTLWAKLDRSTQASVRLRVARTIQAESSRDAADWPFPTMRPMNTYLGQEGNDTEDEALIEFDTDAGDTHHPSTTYETNERPDEHSTLSEPQPPDAGGFSTVEANHPGFETVK